MTIVWIQRLLRQMHWHCPRELILSHEQIQVPLSDKG